MLEYLVHWYIVIKNILNQSQDLPCTTLTWWIFLLLSKKLEKKEFQVRTLKVLGATGLIPYNPATVVKKLKPKGKYAPVSTLVTTPERQSSIIPPQTPANVDQISHIDESISRFHYQTLNTPKLKLLSKLVRGAKLATADRVILNAINAELHEANVWGKKDPNMAENSMMGKKFDILAWRKLGIKSSPKLSNIGIKNCPGDRGGGSNMYISE